MFKFLHVLGVVLLLGNVTASAVWKVFANRTADIAIVAFAQRLVTYTDWTLTLGGVVLIALGGYGMAWTANLELRAGWLVLGQTLFLLSGIIWLLRLVPIQMEQSALTRAATALGDRSELPVRFRQLCRWWIAWGVVATIPLVAATYFMVMKT